MISVCQTYNDFKGAMNTWQKGHFRPLSFIYALHEASMEIFNEARAEFEKTQVINDKIRPYIKRAQVPINELPQGSMVDYPADYSQFSSLRFFTKKGDEGVGVMCGLPIFDIKEKKCRDLTEEEKAELENNKDELIEKTIDKVDNQRWGAAIDHEFLGPSLTNPLCTQYNDGFKVMPSQLGIVVLDYLAIPERPTFIYTKDPKHNIICDNTKCVNLLWGEEILPELMSRLKTKYASFVSNSQMYAEGSKETAATS